MGENNGKAYFKMDDLGGKPAIFWKQPCFFDGTNDGTMKGKREGHV